MKLQSFNFELKDLIRQFTTALDGCIINRYHDTTRAIADKIDVKYVYAPKQKVIEDLVNKGANVKLPAVAITISNLQYDRERVFNKLDELNLPQGTFDACTTSQSDSLGMPVPVKLTVNVSILAKFQTDMDQIMQNFIVNSNPYFVISWKIPAGYTTQPIEIRNKVTWDGNIALTFPVDIQATQTSHIEANTTFTIDGWLFPSQPQPAKNILVVIENLIPVDTIEGLP